MTVLIRAIRASAFLLPLLLIAEPGSARVKEITLKPVAKSSTDWTRSKVSLGRANAMDRRSFRVYRPSSSDSSLMVRCRNGRWWMAFREVAAIGPKDTAQSLLEIFEKRPLRVRILRR